MKKHIWKVFGFAGWFITLLGIIMGLLYGSIVMGAELYGSALLVVVGIIFILVGEFLLAERSKLPYNMIWQALSIGGAFSLTVGIIWLVIQFLQTYSSWFSIIILLALGISLVIIGESIKFEA